VFHSAIREIDLPNYIFIYNAIKKKKKKTLKKKKEILLHVKTKNPKDDTVYKYGSKVYDYLVVNR